MKRVIASVSICIILLFCGCGSLTKMRYSRGFKANIEFRSGKKERQKENITASKANMKRSVKHDLNPLNSFIGADSIVKEAKPCNLQQPKPILTKVKAFNTKRRSWLNLQSVSIFKKASSNSVNSRRPIEPRIPRAILLLIFGFIIGVIGGVCMAPGLVYPMLIIGSVLLSLGIFMVLWAYLLAIKSLQRIRRFPGEFKGSIINIIIITLVSAAILIMLYSILVSLAFI